MQILQSYIVHVAKLEGGNPNLCTKRWSQVVQGSFKESPRRCTLCRESVIIRSVSDVQVTQRYTTQCVRYSWRTPVTLCDLDISVCNHHAVASWPDLPTYTHTFTCYYHLKSRKVWSIWWCNGDVTWRWFEHTAIHVYGRSLNLMGYTLLTAHALLARSVLIFLALLWQVFSVAIRG